MVYMTPMNHSTKYDIVVAGAGPAGSMLAYWLAERGLKVLVVEKKGLPRYKACGGGVTRRATALLPFSVEHLVEDFVREARLSYKNDPVYTRRFETPIIEMVMRNDLDNFLVEKAVAAGADVVTNTTVRTVSGKPGDLVVETSDRTFRAAVAAACDGAGGRISQSLGLSVKCKFMTAVEGELYFGSPWLLDSYKGRVHFDFGVVPRGYGWVFAKKDHLSVGIVTLDKRFDGWKRRFYEYLGTKKLTGFSRIRPLKGGRIPFSPSPGNILANGKGLAAGDAAGFADPITGEGIYYALKSAKIASRTIVESLESGFDVMNRYTERINLSLAQDLKWAGRMSQVLYAAPFITKAILKGFGKTMAENELKVILARQSYTDIKRKFFSPFHIAKKILDRATPLPPDSVYRHLPD